jgi:NAD(P)H-hydrate epimerase
MAEDAGPPLTALEMAVAEANAVALGVPVDALMENAGRVVAEEASKHLAPPPGRVGVVAGPGNNGGDGSAAAHYLAQWGYTIDLWYVVPPSEIRSPAARRCYERAAKRFPVHVGPTSASELSGLSLIVDGILGTGQVGPLRASYQPAVAAIRESGIPSLSIDMPTGVGDPKGLRPKWTVTLTALKEGMTAERCGEIVVRDIGIPIEARIGTGPGEFLYYPTLAARGRRGRSARVFVIGGGPYSGAPALAALAALRVGAERATVIAPQPAADRIQGFSPNLVVVPVGEERFRPRDVQRIRTLLYEARPKAVIVGMGAGRDPETTDALRTLFEAILGTVPLVVDADGLDALPHAARRPGGYDVVATPNAGEFVRVFQGQPDGADADRLRSVRSIAVERGLALLVKGPDDLISDGRSVALNANHHPAMTVSGAGDVLAGAVGALLGEGIPAIGACRLGCYLVGEAGTRGANERGFGLIATDILDRLPAALVEGLARVRPPL